MSRTSKLLRFGVIATCLGALLSACQVETNVTVDIGRDGSGKITIVAIADKDIMNEVPDLAEDLNFSDLDEAWLIDGPSKTDSGGLRVQISHDFNTPTEATKLLSALNGDKGPFKDLALTRTGSANKSTFNLSGTLEVNGGLSAFADAEIMKLIGDPPFQSSLEYSNVDIGDAVNINLIANLPGELKKSNGTLTANGAQSWHVTFDGNSTEIKYTTINNDVAATTASIVRKVLIVVAALWLVGAGVLAVFVARAQRRRASRRTPSQ